MLEILIMELDTVPRLASVFEPLRLCEASVVKDENPLEIVSMPVTAKDNEVLLGTLEVPKEVPEPKFPTIGAPVPLDSIPLVDKIAELDSIGTDKAEVDTIPALVSNP